MYVIENSHTQSLGSIYVAKMYISKRVSGDTNSMSCQGSRVPKDTTKKMWVKRAVEGYRSKVFNN